MTRRFSNRSALRTMLKERSGGVTPWRRTGLANSVDLPPFGSVLRSLRKLLDFHNQLRRQAIQSPAQPEESIDRRHPQSAFNVNVAARSPQDFDYDTNGNLLSDGIRDYEWDSLSRLTRITWAVGKTTEFKYNALGQRCERIETDGAATANTYHLFDGIEAIDRRSGTTADSATSDRRYFSQGEQRWNGSSWISFHYCRDHLGSIREVVKSDGSLRARYDYTPYGERITQYQTSGYSGGCDFGFTGHLTTPSPVAGQTEMVLTHFRAYDPALGTWLSADPIGEEGGKQPLRICVLGR